jgi:hypothetical protein
VTLPIHKNKLEKDFGIHVNGDADCYNEKLEVRSIWRDLLGARSYKR